MMSLRCRGHLYASAGVCAILESLLVTCYSCKYVTVVLKNMLFYYYIYYYYCCYNGGHTC